MQIFQTAVDSANARNGFEQKFGDAVKREQPSKGQPKGRPASLGTDVPTNNFSSGGLEAPDGQTRDPFPPSLVAYIEILRSVAEYLRQRNSGGSIEAATGLNPDKVTPPKDEVDVAEPTTFAIGEEENAECGGPIPVEPDGGIGDGAGPIPFPPEATTLAIGEEDGGGPFPVEADGGIGDGAGPPPIPFGDPRDGPGRFFDGGSRSNANL